MKRYQKLLIFFFLLTFHSCFNPIDEEPIDEETITEEENTVYTTTLTTAISQQVKKTEQKEIQINDIESTLDGTKLSIPINTFTSDTTVTISEVNSPPTPPSGIGFIKSPVSIECTSQINNPITVEIPFSEVNLQNSGISDISSLSVYFYESLPVLEGIKALTTWQKMENAVIDIVDKKIIFTTSKDGYISIGGGESPPPSDLGDPQPGDLVFKQGTILPGINNFNFDSLGWRPGHVGIYVGEKKYGEKSYNVIEALSGGVTRSYYNPLSKFGGKSVYMGVRKPKSKYLTSQQRKAIVDFAELQVGKPYAWPQTIVDGVSIIQYKGVEYGLTQGKFVKGDFGSFNCVGLAEKAYELAGVNDGEGLVPDIEENSSPGRIEILTPAEMYNKTEPANIIIKIIAAPIRTVKKSYLGMYSKQRIAAQFSLNTNTYISKIEIYLRAVSSEYKFEYSLQNSLLPSEDYIIENAKENVIVGDNTITLELNKTFTPSDYYILGIFPDYFGSPAIAGNVNGWWLSDGTYLEIAGTVCDGRWVELDTGWKLSTGDYVVNNVTYHADALAFSIYGYVLKE